MREDTTLCNKSCLEMTFPTDAAGGIESIHFAATLNNHISFAKMTVCFSFRTRLPAFTKVTTVVGAGKCDTKNSHARFAGGRFSRTLWRAIEQRFDKNSHRDKAVKFEDIDIITDMVGGKVGKVRSEYPGTASNL